MTSQCPQTLHGGHFVGPWGWDWAWLGLCPWLLMAAVPSQGPRAIGLRPLSSMPRGHLWRAAHNTREAGSMGVDKQAGARQKARPLPLELPPLAPVIAAHQDLGVTPGPKLGDVGSRGTISKAVIPDYLY